MPAKGWVEINELYCKACELCVTDCPTHVLALDMSRLAPRAFILPICCTRKIAPPAVLAPWFALMRPSLFTAAGAQAALS